MKQLVRYEKGGKAQHSFQRVEIGPFKRCPRCGARYEVVNVDLDFGTCDECYDAGASRSSTPSPSAASGK